MPGQSKATRTWNKTDDWAVQTATAVCRPCFFLGLVVIARAKHPIPSRTRQLSAVAPMVLRLKTWESRSPPNLERNTTLSLRSKMSLTKISRGTTTDAGWSSPVARQAHNLKVVGSNPTPATKKISDYNELRLAFRGAFCCTNPRSTIGQQNTPNSDMERADDSRVRLATEGPEPSILCGHQRSFVSGRWAARSA